MEDITELSLQKMRGPYISFEYHLNDHCNLNCKGCDHFSPLAEEKFTNYEQFEKDMFSLPIARENNVAHGICGLNGGFYY